MPSQADEEAHQLSYLQKHLSNILSLLTDIAEGEGDETMVCIGLFLMHSHFAFRFSNWIWYVNLSFVFSISY